MSPDDLIVRITDESMEMPKGLIFNHRQVPDTGNQFKDTFKLLPLIFSRAPVKIGQLNGFDATHPLQPSRSPPFSASKIGQCLRHSLTGEKAQESSRLEMAIGHGTTLSFS
jgi:hypothetical protein